MKKIRYFLEYLPVRFLAAFVRLLPRGAAIAFGEGLGLVLSRVISKRQALILDNLSQAFPEKSVDEKKRIARAVWKNIGRTAVEFVRIDEFTRPGAESFL